MYNFSLKPKKVPWVKPKIEQKKKPIPYPKTFKQ